MKLLLLGKSKKQTNLEISNASTCQFLTSWPKVLKKSEHLPLKGISRV